MTSSRLKPRMRRRSGWKTERGLFMRVMDKSIQCRKSDVRAKLEEMIRNSKGSMFEGLIDNYFTYIRFTAYGPGSSMAWTQPFFL